MGLKCICGQDFEDLNKFDTHSANCVKYKETVEIVDKFKEILEAFEDSQKEDKNKLINDYEVAKKVLKQIKKDAKELKKVSKKVVDSATSIAKEVPITAFDPEIYKEAVKLLKLGVITFKKFNKQFGTPTIAVLSELVQLGIISAKKFNKLTKAEKKVAIDDLRKKLKVKTEKYATIVAITGSIAIFFRGLLYSLLGSFDTYLLIPMTAGGSWMGLYLAKKIRIIRKLLKNGNGV